MQQLVLKEGKHLWFLSLLMITTRNTLSGLSKSTRSEAASDQEAKSVEADRKKWTLQLHFLFQLLVVVIFHVCFIYFVNAFCYLGPEPANHTPSSMYLTGLSHSVTKKLGNPCVCVCVYVLVIFIYIYIYISLCSRVYSCIVLFLFDIVLPRACRKL